MTSRRWMVTTPEQARRQMVLGLIRDTCVLLIAAAVFVLGFGMAR